MLFQVIVEYSNNNSIGGSVFQVIDLRDENGTDYGFLIPYDERYLSLNDLRNYIAGELRLDPEEIELEEV